MVNKRYSKRKLFRLPSRWCKSLTIYT